MDYNDVITEFGRRMGLPNLALGQGRPICLHIDGMGVLFLEEGEASEEVLVCLSRKFPTHDQEAPRRALLLCGPERARPFPVYAGLYKDSLVFMTRFSSRNFSIQNLEQAVPILSALLDETLRN